MRNVVTSNVGKVSVSSREAFRHYRETAKHRDKQYTNHLSVYRKIINRFYEKIAEDLINNDGGVFIKDLGYFTIMVHPKKQMVKVPYNKGGYANFKTDNYLYLPTFFGFGKGNPLLNFWVMDRTFSKRKVRTKLHEALVKGKKYKNFIATISSLYLFKDKT